MIIFFYYSRIALYFSTVLDIEKKSFYYSSKRCLTALNQHLFSLSVFFLLNDIYFFNRSRNVKTKRCIQFVAHLMSKVCHTYDKAS